MWYATTTRIAASVAIGINAAHRPAASVITSSVSACTMPATGVRPPFLTFVAVRAMAPVAGMPPKIGDAMFATPCATSSMFERWRPPIMPSATTAESSDSIAASSAIVKAGPIRTVTWASERSRQRGRRNPRRDRAEAGPDRLHRQRERLNDDRRDDERHERRREARD